MNPDEKLTCPCCGEKFTKSEAAWTVCLTCGDIFPPGETSANHGPGPIYEDEDEIPEDRHIQRPLIKEWPCNTSLRVYTEEAAKAKQEEVRADD